jgi:hypothetical protein
MRKNLDRGQIKVNNLWFRYTANIPSEMNEYLVIEPNLAKLNVNSVESG